jgi:excisionase family DNA binding protein
MTDDRRVKFFSVEEIKRLLRTSKSEIYRLVNFGDIKAVTSGGVGRKWRIPIPQPFFDSFGITNYSQVSGDGGRAKVIRFFTVQEIADFLGYSETTVRRMLVSGQIKSFKLGSSYNSPKIIPVPQPFFDSLGIKNYRQIIKSTNKDEYAIRGFDNKDSHIHIQSLPSDFPSPTPASITPVLDKDDIEIVDKPIEETVEPRSPIPPRRKWGKIRRRVSSKGKIYYEASYAVYGSRYYPGSYNSIAEAERALDVIRAEIDTGKWNPPVRPTHWGAIEDLVNSKGQIIYYPSYYTGGKRHSLGSHYSKSNARYILEVVKRAIDSGVWKLPKQLELEVQPEPGTQFEQEVQPEPDPTPASTILRSDKCDIETVDESIEKKAEPNSPRRQGRRRSWGSIRRKVDARGLVHHYASYTVKGTTYSLGTYDFRATAEHDLQMVKLKIELGRWTPPLPNSFPPKTWAEIQAEKEPEPEAQPEPEPSIRRKPSHIVLNETQVKEILGVDTTELNALVAARELTGTRIGNRLFFGSDQPVFKKFGLEYEDIILLGKVKADDNE